MTQRSVATRARELGEAGVAIWAGLETTVAGRFLRDFIAMRAVDRALALASKLFIAVLPLSILSTSLVSGRAFSDQIVERFGLSGAGASAARALFAAPAQVQAGVGLLGVLILTSSALSFTRALERTYLDAWRLSPLRGTALRNRLEWLAAFIVVSAAIAAAHAALTAAGAAVAIWVLTAVAGSLFFLWTPYVLLGRRVDWRRLLPTSMLTGAGLLALGIGSAIVMPELVSRNTERYGLIGFTFSMVSWLFSAALVIIAMAILGAVLDDEDTDPRPSSGEP
jgi:membrane protein